MKGTRLWQAPGSPIIQGRSRTARPFWQVWLAAALVGVVVVVCAAFLISLLKPGLEPAAAAGAALMTILGPALPGCVLGSALGVGVSRTMGWRRQWLVGGFIGAALAGITIAFL